MAYYYTIKSPVTIWPEALLFMFEFAHCAMCMGKCIRYMLQSYEPVPAKKRIRVETYKIIVLFFAGTGLLLCSMQRMHLPMHITQCTIKLLFLCFWWQVLAENRERENRASCSSEETCRRCAPICVTDHLVANTFHK